jgi:hypothetical protein
LADLEKLKSDESTEHALQKRSVAALKVASMKKRSLETMKQQVGHAHFLATPIFTFGNLLFRFSMFSYMSIPSHVLWHHYK